MPCSKGIPATGGRPGCLDGLADLYSTSHGAADRDSGSAFKLSIGTTCLRALQTHSCTPRGFHGRSHGTARPAARHSVVLACLLLACIERGGMVRVIPGRGERGVRWGPASTVCEQFIWPAVLRQQAECLAVGILRLRSLLAKQRTVAPVPIAVEAITLGARVGEPPPLPRRRRECRLHLAGGLECAVGGAVMCGPLESCNTRGIASRIHLFRGPR
jgi:hypothetical protein